MSMIQRLFQFLRGGTSALILLVMMTGCQREAPPRLIRAEIKEHVITQGMEYGLLEMAADAGRLRFQILIHASATDRSHARMSGACTPQAVDYTDLLALLQSHQFVHEPSGTNGNRVELMRWWSDGTNEAVTFFGGGKQYASYNGWRIIFSNLASGRPFNQKPENGKLDFTSGCGQE